MPVFVRRTEPMPAGNRLLLERGELPLDEPVPPAVPRDWSAAAIPAAPPRRKGRKPAAAVTASVDQQSLKMVD